MRLILVNNEVMTLEELRNQLGCQSIGFETLQAGNMEDLLTHGRRPSPVVVLRGPAEQLDAFQELFDKLKANKALQWLVFPSAETQVSDAHTMANGVWDRIPPPATGMVPSLLLDHISTLDTELAASASSLETQKREPADDEEPCLGAASGEEDAARSFHEFCSATEEAVILLRDGRISAIDADLDRKLGAACAIRPGDRVGRLLTPADRRTLHEWLSTKGRTATRGAENLHVNLRGTNGDFPVALERIPPAHGENTSVLLLHPLGDGIFSGPSWDLVHPLDLDPITALPEGQWFHEAVRQYIARARQSQLGCCVAVCRVEGLSSLERELGSAAMRDIYQTVATRLRRSVGVDGALARLAPLEFGCVFVSADPQSAAEQKVLSFQRAIRPPVSSESGSRWLSLRFGFATWSEQQQRPRALIQTARTRASVAALLDKAPDTSLQRASARRTPSALEVEIDRACDRDEFELFLQPVIHMRSFQVRGAEVLVRWRHPERGLLAPAHFLPMAESTGQIARIGRYVLRAVCARAHMWSQMIPHRARFAVNVSPVELHDAAFLSTTLGILAEVPDLPVDIELEITETAVLASEAKTVEVVERLRREGIRVALDDFGAGFSSLAHLREIPFSKLKVDRTFVQGSLSSHRCRTIVRSMVELARGLRIEINAEGVEKPEQLRFLYESGCDEVQGYLFARPMPCDRFEKWVAGYQGKAAEALSSQVDGAVDMTANGSKVLPFQRRRSKP